LLAKAATHFQASAATPNQRKHADKHEHIKFADDPNSWKFDKPTDTNAPLSKYGKTWWFCTKCKPPRYSLHKTSEHRDNFAGQFSKKRKVQDRKPQVNVAASSMTPEEAQNAMQTMTCFLASTTQGVQTDVMDAANADANTTKKSKKMQRRKGSDGGKY